MTTEKRDFLGNLLRDNYELIQQDFLNLDSYQRCNILVKILPYIMPKVQPVSETEEQKRAAEQLKLYSNLADKVFFWEQQRQKQLQEQEEQQEQKQMQQEETKHDPRLNSSTLDNTTLPFSVGNGSAVAQSAGEAPSLNPSTLDNAPQTSEAGNAPCPEQSASETQLLNPSTLDNDKQIGISEEEMKKSMRLQVYHKYAPLLDEKTQAELAYCLMNKYGVSPQELLINGKFPLYSSTLDPTTTSNNPTAEVGGTSCSAKSSEQESSLNSSTLDQATTSNNPTAEVGGASCPAKSSEQESSLNSSTLDTDDKTFSAASNSRTAQSAGEAPSTKQSAFRPLKQQQRQPFYADIANKRRRR